MVIMQVEVNQEVKSIVLKFEVDKLPLEVKDNIFQHLLCNDLSYLVMRNITLRHRILVRHNFMVNRD